MLELLPSPASVLAMRASGRIEQQDIERAIQAVEAALASHERIAIYAEIEMFGITPGALVRDLTYSLGKLRELRRFPRIAVVTGQEWVRALAKVEDRVFPQIEIRAFGPEERDAAMAWASQPLPAPPAEAERPSEPSVRLLQTDRPDLLAFEVNGRIRREDMQILISAFEHALDAHPRLRVLVKVSTFDGVTLEALRTEGLAAMKLRGLRQVERYAVIGGPDWMEGVARRFSSWLPVRTRHFEAGEEAAAWDWAKGEDPSNPKPVTAALLDAFADAWNRHDVDAIMAAMTPDCIYQQSGGPDVHGRRFVGQAEVRRAVEELFAAFPDARWNGATHVIAGDRGVSEWVFTATGPDGATEVAGCDVFTFRHGKIAVKNSFRKQRDTRLAEG